MINKQTNIVVEIRYGITVSCSVIIDRSNIIAITMSRDGTDR